MFVPTTQIEHPGWQSHAFLQLPIKKALKPPKKSTRPQDDLLSCLPGEDTSLSIDRLLSQLDFNKALQQKNLLDGSDPFLLASQAQTPKGGDLSLGGSSALDSLRNPPPICFTDLKPLHRLVTLPEVTGFLQLASPANFEQSSTQEVATVGFPDRLTIQNIIDRYGRNGENLITEDTFVAGVDEQGKAVVSDFSKIAHRLIAGVTGSGKTNFINAIIYQFLYAQPDRMINLADFQAGMHYQLLVDYQRGIQLITQLDDFANLLETLWQEHDNRRMQMGELRVRSLKDLKQKHNISHPRRLLIIDEAFYIQNASREIKPNIEKYLSALMAQARVTGIHIVYCSQRPTPDVIPKSISDNMDERVLFRVQSGSSVQLLDSDRAAHLPVDPPGRAIYRGADTSLKLIATPFVPDDIWEQPIR